MYDRDRFNRGPPRDRRDKRFPGEERRDFRQHREEHYRPPTQEERRPQEPSPVDGRCSQLCPLFWCSKRAYQPRRDLSTGRRYVFCTWIGDECIGYSCQYATCRMNYLLPDGSCAWVKQRAIEVKEEEGIADTDILDEKTKSLVYRKLGKRLGDEVY